VSTWIVGYLKLAGVNTDLFKAHSTRSAATSKVAKAGVSLKEIVKRGRWSKESTFLKYYCKPISNEDNTSFEQKVLKQ